MKSQLNTHTLKAITLAVSLAFAGVSFNTTAADVNDADTTELNTKAVDTGTVNANPAPMSESTQVEGSTTVTNDWQSPTAAAFSKLDASGNGLLLPSEASKGKAFNKKTFAAADVDHDGTIDVKEYTAYKTGGTPQYDNTSANTSTQGPSAAKNADSQDLVTSADNSAGSLQMADSMDTKSTTEKGSVGVVVDDSVITTKAKAEILGTKNLKSLQISVETHQGEVTLSGMVDNAEAKMKAEEVVSKIAGVKSVKNSLEVKG